MSRDLVAPRFLRDHLLAHGLQVVQLVDVSRFTGLTPKAAADAMARLRRTGQFFSPTPGLYVAIPPHYATWGAVPAIDFIDPMMKALGRAYYVALLSAAELHGAAHQRPQVFQVMVDRTVGDRDFARVRLRFYSSTLVHKIPVIRRNSATGQVAVATPEATALDLAGRPHDAGGLDNVATVLAELAEAHVLRPEVLAQLAPIYPAAVARRLGWLLDRVSPHADTAAPAEALAEVLGARLRASTPAGRRAVDLLDPAGPRRGPADPRWRLVVNTDVEPDL